MSKLPLTTTSVSTLQAKQEAVDTVSSLIERNMELEEINELLQPLLYALSMKLYTDDTPVTLHKLVTDSLELLKGN